MHLEKSVESHFGCKICESKKQVDSKGVRLCFVWRKIMFEVEEFVFC